MPGRQLSLEVSPEETVVKSNRLVKAKTPFSKLEHRIVAALIAQLKKGQEAFSKQKVSLKEITDLAEVQSTDIYRKATALCDSLAQKSVSIQEEGEDGGRRYRAIPIFSECSYVEKRGVIEAEFNGRMGDVLLELTGRFTTYALPFFLRLSSRYSMRVYELLKMREGLKELIISVEELREILSLENKYEQFSTLKHHVLEKAREEVAQRTDISFTYQVKRKGQTPVQVTFYIEEQLQGAAASEEDQEPQVRRRSYNYDRSVERSGVQVDPKRMFKADLSQKELSTLTEEELNTLYTEACSKVEDKAGQVWAASETLRRMKDMWQRQK